MYTHIHHLYVRYILFYYHPLYLLHFCYPCHFKEHPYLHCYIFFPLLLCTSTYFHAQLHIPGVGASALTGGGLFTPILMLINAFAMLAGAGGAPRAAISMEKRITGQQKGSLKLLFSSYHHGSCTNFYFLYFCPTDADPFGASDKTLPYAVAYSRIYILGSIFVLIVMGMNLFITTQGFAKISMLTTVIGAIINIILDPIFIFVLDLGVRGAALATVLSQAVGAVWIFRFLTGKKTILHLRKENFRLRRDIILPCLALGISTFVMLSTESILSISFTSSLSRYGGDLAVGAMTIITSVSQLVTMPVQGSARRSADHKLQLRYQ